MPRIPGRSMAMIGASPASTPKSPSEPGRSTCSTSPENSSFSGETRSKWKVAMASCARYSLLAIRSLASRRFRRELLALLHRLLDGADHVEGGLRQVIVFSLAQTLEAANGVGELDEHTGRSGEDLGDVEGLREIALDLARACDGELVLFRQLVHAQDRDDVLQRLVALQDLLHLACDGIMLLAHDHGREHARGRVERVDGGIDALLRDRARQHGGGVEVGE